MKDSGLAHHDVSLENVIHSDKEGDHIALIDLGMCIRVPQPATTADGSTAKSPVRLVPLRSKGKASYVVCSQYYS